MNNIAKTKTSLNRVNINTQILTYTQNLRDHYTYMLKNLEYRVIKLKQQRRIKQN